MKTFNVLIRANEREGRMPLSFTVCVFERLLTRFNFVVSIFVTTFVPTKDKKEL